MTDPTFDRRQLMAEIEAEVRERREAGDFPAGFEAELDAIFDRFAPPAAVDDFDAVLDQAEARAFIDGFPPLESRNGAIRFIKRILAKFSFWYVRAVAFRVTEFTASISRAVRLLGRRVDRIERAVPAVDPRVRDELVALVTPSDTGAWITDIAAMLDGVDGRVLVAESGDAKLLGALRDRGIDAYGAEPRRSLVDDAVLAGLEVRHEEASDHLRSLVPNVLGAVVIIGCADRLAVGAQLDLADLVASRVRVGGQVIVASVTPQHWSSERSPVELDLAPGRPLHHETWAQILTKRGIGQIEVRESADTTVLDRVPGDDDATAVLNRNLDRLARHAFGPSGYLVAGVRER
ncbi:MAG: methionine biosynthesis protein MetW [Acidimicrobiia bacterium]